MGGIKLGIPRSLFYYLFFPFWEEFFKQIGIQVVTSAETTKEIITAGIEEAVTDACIPVKVFHGHVVSLKQKVDLLFIPRLVRWNDTDTFCPKFLGLPDMIKHGIKGLPPILAPRLNVRHIWSSWLVCREIAQQFKIPLHRTWRAYRQALAVLERYRRLLAAGWTPQEAAAILRGQRITKAAHQLKVAVLGYPYNIYDRFVSADIVQKLRDLNVATVTADMLDGRLLKRQVYDPQKQAFWHFSDNILRAGTHFINGGAVDGIIHLTAFGCGPDFLVNKLLEMEAHRRQHPFITISIDEQSGDAGIRTRLEAFVDMLRFRTARREEASTDGH